MAHKSVQGSHVPYTTFQTLLCLGSLVFYLLPIKFLLLFGYLIFLVTTSFVVFKLKLKVNMILVNIIFTPKFGNVKASDLNFINLVGCPKIENCLTQLNLIAKFWYIVSLTYSKRWKRTSNQYIYLFIPIKLAQGSLAQYSNITRSFQKA